MFKSWQDSDFSCAALWIFLFSLPTASSGPQSFLSISLHFKLPLERREHVAAGGAKALHWLLNSEDKMPLQVAGFYLSAGVYIISFFTSVITDAWWWMFLLIFCQGLSTSGACMSLVHKDFSHTGGYSRDATWQIWSHLATAVSA